MFDTDILYFCVQAFQYTLPPDKVVYIERGTGKDLKEEAMRPDIAAYNDGVLFSTFLKTKDRGEAAEMSLMAMAMALMHDNGISTTDALRISKFLPNRACMGCGQGKRGDVVKGWMYCSAPRCQGQSVSQMADFVKWLQQPFDKWCYSVKSA